MATKPVYQCKLCSLLKTNRDLWIKVHNFVLRDKRTKTDVCAWLNQQIEVLNVSLPTELQKPKFNVVNFSKHFKLHVPDEDKIKAELEASLLNERRENGGFTEEERLIVDAVANPTDLSQSYQEYPETLARFEEIIMRDFASAQAISDNNGHLRPIAADQKLKLLSQLLTTKKQLSDIQKSALVGGEAVRAAIRLLGTTMYEKSKVIGEEVSAIVEQVSTTDHAAQVKDMVTQRILEELRTRIPEILDTIFKTYGIK
jgi:hypothetical protein